MYISHVELKDYLLKELIILWHTYSSTARGPLHEQGCTLSPDLFNLVLEAVMRLALENEEVGLELCGRLANNL